MKGRGERNPAWFIIFVDDVISLEYKPLKASLADPKFLVMD